MAEEGEIDWKNYTRLDVLLGQACVTLRNLFRKRWETFHGKPWMDTSEDGGIFIKTLGADIYNKATLPQKKILASGDVNTWDLTALAQVLKTDKEESRYFQQLAEVRNKLAHLGSKELSEDEFQNMWEKVATVLTHFDYPSEKLEELRTADNIGGIEFQSSKAVNSDSVREAKRLREEGNKELKDGNVDLALKKYTKAILLPDVSELVLAMLYCNRANAYLEQSKNERTSSGMFPMDFKGTLIRRNALEDAMKAVNLRSNFWKAHYVLGRIHEANGEIKKALKAFDQSIVLDPHHDEVKSAREACHFKLGKSQEEGCVKVSFEDKVKKLKDQRGLVLSKTSRTRLKKAEGVRGESSLDLLQAYKFRDSRGADKNYEMAAKLFAKVAGKGNAEGMFNLAVLTLDGLGVKKDVDTAVTWLKQAATQPLTVDGHRNVGVAEAENVLGLLYAEGTGLDRDYSKAITWFQRATEHGFADAADNLERLRNAGCKNEVEGNGKNGQMHEMSPKAVAENVVHVQDFEQVHPLNVAAATVSEFQAKNETTVTNPRNDHARLSDTFRIKLIKSHRASIADQSKDGGSSQKSKTVKQNCLSQLIGLEAITLQEMDQTRAHLYEGFVLQVTSIEDPKLGSGVVAVVVEDENGDIQRCLVYNFANENDIEKKLGFGCKISIINPQMILAEDGDPAIQVDGQRTCLFFHPGREINRCRYCGKSNASKKCSRCRIALYCSKQCQTSDWNLLDHKKICKKLC